MHINEDLIELNRKEQELTRYANAVNARLLELQVTGIGKTVKQMEYGISSLLICYEDGTYTYFERDDDTHFEPYPVRIGQYQARFIVPELYQKYREMYDALQVAKSKVKPVSIPYFMRSMLDNS